jgi:hypothetical protein
MPEAIHSHLPLWLDPRRREDAPVDLGTLKSELARQGINSRSWRLYLDYGDALFAPLGRPWIHPDQPFTSGPSAVAYLRLLQACEMDVLPPPGLVASLQFWGVPNVRLDCVPPMFFRAAWKAAVANQYERRAAAEFIREVIFVGLWFFGTGAYETADSGLLKAGWPALLRRQKTCSLEQAPVVLPRNASTGDEWDPYIRRVEWGLYRFEALTNAAQLLEEGEAMQHCVGTYPEYCRCGARRIYSVRERKSGRRMATFSIEYVDYGNGRLAWRFDQLSGLSNAEILQPDMIIAADAVLRAYFDLPAQTFAKPVLPTTAEDEANEEEWCCDF